MAKSYLIENKYSYLEDLRVVQARHSYKVENPSTAFEHQMQSDLAKARGYQLEDELGLALDGYQRLQALILKTVHPQLPVDAGSHPSWVAPVDPGIFKAVLDASAHTMAKTPLRRSSIPGPNISPTPAPRPMSKALEPYLGLGPSDARRIEARPKIEAAVDAANRGDWAAAAESLHGALERSEDDPVLKGFIEHDLGIVAERSGDAGKGKELLERAERTFKDAGSAEGRAAALTSLAGLAKRQGKDAEVTRLLDTAGSVSRKAGIHPVEVRGLQASVGAPVTSFANGLGNGAAVGLHPLPVAVAVPGSSVALETPLSEEAGAGMLATANLLAFQYVERESLPAKMTVLGGDAHAVTIDLTANVSANLESFYGNLQKTRDLTLLHCQLLPATQLVAYIPYIYFFVLPMSIGDCLRDMGQWAEAEQQYLKALKYPYLNQNVEVVRVWTRLAELMIAWGDELYRGAGDRVASYAVAAAKYAQVVTAADQIPDGSPLYASSTFAAMKTRAAAIAAAADPRALDENPVIVRAIVEARMRLGQIEAGLNFFGYSGDYVPPFSFEYLQTLARYFAQHAAAVEQGYIRFKSQAEEEEFRRDQLEGQVAVAKASVDLEQRGLEEAQAGVAAAQAGVDYAETQRQNALDAQQEFNATRWEQLQLEELYAWANAAAQDEDDEVRLTIPEGYTYYHTNKRRRSLVVQDLARRRTLLAQEQQAQRLAAEVASAAAYKGVAEAQLGQAEARVGTARQRIVVAQLQQRLAEENRDFLDMREFGSRLWYELARVMRGLSRTYLDQAIEIASLMERAYTAETDRRLRKIRFDYRWSGPDQLLGAEMLLSDIDFFSYDYVTSTRSKKAPIKLSLSLADSYPLAFSRLKATGTAMFETTLEQLDRLYPGYYLHKVRDVELLFVGVTGSGSFHGTLRNIGVSSFRGKAGNLRQLVYPGDVMPISQYDVRQDALVFHTDSKELRLFENNGAATMWQIDLPPSANDFDPADLVDVRLVLYYDAFFDSTLESAVKASLPSSGTGTKLSSLRLQAPDELFYLRNRDSGSLRLTEDDLPRSQTTWRRTKSTLRLLGDGALVAGLTLRLTPSSTGTELTVTTDSEGAIAGSTSAEPLGALIGKPLVDEWAIEVRAEDNPGKPVADGSVDLTGLTDVQAVQEYEFDYR